MTANFKIKDASGWTMFIFGAIALLLGLIGLIRPEIMLTILGFDVLDRTARIVGDYTLVFLTASSMASFNIGVYYLLSAFHDFKAFYKWTVPFRGLTFLVFTTASLTGLAPMGFITVGVWELTGAIATSVALRNDRLKETTSDKKRNTSPAKARPSSTGK